MLNYPYFVDVRGTGVNADAPILSGIDQVTVSWASPLTISAEAGVQATTLLSTGPGAWLSSSTDISPQLDAQGNSGFVPPAESDEQGERILGVALQGRFESFYAGGPSPLLAASETAESQSETDGAANLEPEADDLGVIDSVIERSPESARLIVFGSNDFVADQILQMVGSADGTMYSNSLEMMVNLVDWAVEDQSLIGIRSRGNFNRTLPNLEVAEQSTLEYLNYLFALLGVAGVGLLYRLRQARRHNQQQHWVTGESA